MLYEDNCLAHYGIKGQRWGIRRFQNEDGTLTAEGKQRYGKNDTIFVSGSSKTEDKNSGYYRKKLPTEVRKEIDAGIKAKSKFVVGDAPGIDRQVQRYLNKKKYDNVEVYGPGKEVRFVANKKWKTNPIDDPDHEPMSPEWLAKKDKAMTDVATKGLAVVLDEGAKATRNNVARLQEQNKDVKVFSLNESGVDDWFDEKVQKTRNLIREMKEVQYKPFDKLMSPEQVEKTKQGSCHDQVMYELYELKKIGLDPKALFIMEHTGNQGGMTHSLVYFMKNNKAYWVENAWSERAGVRVYDNVEDIKKEIRNAHKSGDFGDKSTYHNLSFGDFNDKEQLPGESLQELVDHIKWDRP